MLGFHEAIFGLLLAILIGKLVAEFLIWLAGGDPETREKRLNKKYFANHPSDDPS